MRSKQQPPLLVVGCWLLVVGCWSHVRKQSQICRLRGKTGKAGWTLNHTQKLYRVENATKAVSLQEKPVAREQQNAPLLAQFKAWLEKSSYGDFIN
ncbi:MULTISPECIES: IS66 family transposase [Pseudoalteromonas]|uniref:Transposase n=1 Tax=Pseudoalteromonas maricaloris TaxID=184924 RepID=A0ABZ0MAH1_9GAMM|nr:MULTISPECIES: transposase [Pseudoalteromonas]WMO15160.1 transposase [Pseudoalteromonas piscicida]WOX28826.1 transposase [Pseudoalteromonas maricaloris]